MVTTSRPIPCIGCGYDVTGLPRDGNCPECAHPVAESTAFLGPITGSLPCIRCEYELHGFAYESKCPECGAPVGASLKRSLLRFAPLPFVSRLRNGYLLLSWTAGVGLPLLLLSLIGSIYGSSSAAQPGMSFDDQVILVGILAGLIGFFVVAVGVPVGWFMVTKKDPRKDERYGGEGARRYTRSFVVLMIAPIVLIPFSRMVGGAAGFARPLLLLLVIGSMIAPIGLYFASLSHSRWIAGRLPSRRLAKRATLLMWLGPLLCLLGMFFLFLGPFAVMLLYWWLIYGMYAELEATRKRLAAAAVTRNGS